MLRKKLFRESHLNTPNNQENNDDPSNTASKRSKHFHEDISDTILNIEKELNENIKDIKFPSSVGYVYNPVEYAYTPHEKYVKTYCKNRKNVLFLGMNPGPFGMCQTGVPFGEVKAVKEWLEIDCEIAKPDVECPYRPIMGFQCTRSEVSGKRFWGLFRRLCTHPDNFFRFAYVHNYCPIALMASDGKNITPAEIKGEQVTELEKHCDNTLVELVKVLEADTVVGIGTYATNKAIKVLRAANLDKRVVCLIHPSPRAKNNTNWEEKAENFLNTHELMQYFTTSNWMVN